MPPPVHSSVEATTDNSSALRGSSQLIAPGATFPNFHLDTSYDRSICSKGVVGVPLFSLDSLLSSLPAGWPGAHASQLVVTISLKPYAKTRRMSESNVKEVERL